MIDEYWTWQFYGYCSDELTHGSHKPIVARCDECCKYRVLHHCNYRDLCVACCRRGTKLLPRSKEVCGKISKANKGRKLLPLSKEHKRKISATFQGIPYEDWTEFVSNGAYCEKFDDACRERIREKYNRLCYACDKNENDNGKKLSVHHIDQDKNQGCDGVKWKLIPLCASCHGKSHFNPFKSRLEYLLSIEEMVVILQQTETLK